MIKEHLIQKLDSADACCEVQIVDGQGDVDGTYMLNTRLIFILMLLMTPTC